MAPATVPGAPGLTARQNKPRGVALAWTAPASNGGSAITGYRIYRSTSPGTEILFATVGAVLKYKDTATTKGMVYYYNVVAVSAMGDGAFSNEASAVAR